uniref:Protein-serine/threonine kinase n=1 Tax=Arcella intermedia TaxID=1963864 RepID=A0A6B2L8R0_9EUKA
MTSFGSIPSNEKKLAISTDFLLHELRVRYSHMIWSLNSLPFSETSPVPTMIELCAITLDELFSHPELTIQDAHKYVPTFTDLVKRMLNRHQDDKLMLSQGLVDWKHSRQDLTAEMNTAIDRGIDTFLSHRIATRVISHHHVALYDEPNREGYIGAIEKKCSPAKIAERVSEDVSEMFNVQRGNCPPIKVLGNISLSFSYIPVHIYYILIELVKNSAMATLKTHSKGLPPINIIVAQGKEDFCIKVEDEGGGIPRTRIDQVWTYAFTSEASPFHHHNISHDPLAGYGFGLPMSRLYARYFGGDLKLMSLDGYGTDAYVFLPRLGNTLEWVPTHPVYKNDEFI